MRIATLFVVASLATGCGFILDPDSRRDALSANDDLILPAEGGPDLVCEYPPMLTSGSHAIDLRDCTKLEGGQLGDDLEIVVGGETVEVSGWRNKDGEGEYIGFDVEGDVIVVVKAGTDLYEAGEGEWTHPAGTSGPSAKGISFVAFCEPPTDEPECRPVDGGGPGSGGGEPGSGGGDGDGSGGSDGDGSNGYCDPVDCEPGGSFGGGGEDGSGDGSTGGSGGADGDGSGGSGSDGDGSSSGGDGSSSGGSSSGDGSGGDGGACAITSCGTDNSCGDGRACFGGCCLDVIG